MVAFKAFAIFALLGLVAGNECPALSNTLGVKPKNIYDLETVDCRVGIQAAECAINTRPSYGQTWAAFRINHSKDCNHGAPYGDCCVFDGKPPVSEDNLEPNESVWLFFWDSLSTGQNPGHGAGCIQDPTNGLCGRQDQGHFTTTGGCPYPPSIVADKYGRIGDGCQDKGPGPLSANFQAASAWHGSVFPKCGPLGKFPAEAKSTPHKTVLCKPTVKFASLHTNDPTHGIGDVDDSTCPNAKHGGLRGGIVPGPVTPPVGGAPGGAAGGAPGGAAGGAAGGAPGGAAGGAPGGKSNPGSAGSGKGPTGPIKGGKGRRPKHPPSSDSPPASSGTGDAPADNPSAGGPAPGNNGGAGTHKGSRTGKSSHKGSGSGGKSRAGPGGAAATGNAGPNGDPPAPDDGWTGPRGGLRGEEEAGGLRGSLDAAAYPSSEEGVPEDVPEQYTTAKMVKRYAKASPLGGGNQFDKGNVGQLSPRGKCCWCHSKGA